MAQLMKQIELGGKRWRRNQNGSPALASMFLGKPRKTSVIIG
jgi:hypothetical protein